MTVRYLPKTRLRAFLFIYSYAVIQLTSFFALAAQHPGAGQRIRPDVGYHLIATRVAGPFHYPWSLAFLPEDNMLVTEKTGQLNIVNHSGVSEKIEGVPEIRAGAEGGLLDVAIADDFTQTGTLFLSYTVGEAGHVSVRLMRAHLDVSRRILTQQHVIFSAAPDGPDNRYLGGRIALAGQFIFLSLGDRGDPMRSQNLSDDAGKIIRLHTDGTLPRTNPFARTAGVRPEIWSYGHRNPEGLVVDSKTGFLWSTEHGPRGGDELNRISPGENYGWPLVSFGKNYDGTPVGNGGTRMTGITDPIWHWTPSIGPSGLALEHNGESIVFWIGALPARQISQLRLQKDHSLKNTIFNSPDLQRVRDVRIGPSGAIYILTDSDQGGLFRLLWQKSK